MLSFGQNGLTAGAFIGKEDYMSKGNTGKKEKIKRAVAAVIAVLLVVAMIVPMVLSVVN